MEVGIINADSLPNGSIISLRFGSTRRQAPLEKIYSSTMKFPSTAETCCDPLRIEVLQPVASSRIVLLKKDSDYEVEMSSKGGKTIRVGLQVRQCPSAVGTKSSPSSTRPAFPVKYQDAAASAREYLEKHGLLIYVQGLLHAVIQSKPEDPFSFMHQQLSTMLPAKQAASPRGAKAAGAAARGGKFQGIDEDTGRLGGAAEVQAKREDIAPASPKAKKVAFLDEELGALLDEARHTMVKASHDGTLLDALEAADEDEPENAEPNPPPILNAPAEKVDQSAKSVSRPITHAPEKAVDQVEETARSSPHNFPGYPPKPTEQAADEVRLRLLPTVGQTEEDATSNLHPIPEISEKPAGQADTKATGSALQSAAIPGKPAEQVDEEAKSMLVPMTEVPTKLADQIEKEARSSLAQLAEQADQAEEEALERNDAKSKPDEGAKPSLPPMTEVAEQPVEQAEESVKSSLSHEGKSDKKVKWFLPSIPEGQEKPSPRPAPDVPAEQVKEVARSSLPLVVETPGNVSPTPDAQAEQTMEEVNSNQNSIPDALERPAEQAGEEATFSPSPPAQQGEQEAKPRPLLQPAGQTEEEAKSSPPSVPDVSKTGEKEARGVRAEMKNEACNFHTKNSQQRRRSRSPCGRERLPISPKDCSEARRISTIVRCCADAAIELASRNLCVAAGLATAAAGIAQGMLMLIQSNEKIAPDPSALHGMAATATSAASVGHKSAPGLIAAAASAAADAAKAVSMASTFEVLGGLDNRQMAVAREAVAPNVGAVPREQEQGTEAPLNRLEDTPSIRDRGLLLPAELRRKAWELLVNAEANGSLIRALSGSSCGCPQAPPAPPTRVEAPVDPPPQLLFVDQSIHGASFVQELRKRARSVLVSAAQHGRLSIMIQAVKQNEAADVHSSAPLPPPEPLSQLEEEPQGQEPAQLPEQPEVDLVPVTPLEIPTEELVALEESFPSHHNGASGVAPPHHHNMASGAEDAQGQDVVPFDAVGIGDDVTEAAGQEMPIVLVPNSVHGANGTGQADIAATNVESHTEEADAAEVERPTETGMHEIHSAIHELRTENAWLREQLQFMATEIQRMARSNEASHTM